MAPQQINFSLCLLSFMLICAVGCATAASSRDSNLFGSKRPRVLVPTCVVRSFLPIKTLENVLDFYCKQPGVDCRVILPGGKCFNPNNLEYHASVAVNQYYRFHNRDKAFCPPDVGALAYPDPSRYECIS